MQNFLDGVRVLNVSAQPGGTSLIRVRDASDANDESPGRTESPAPTSAPPAKHHSDSGNEFLAVPICAIVFTFIYLIIKAIMAPFTQRARYARQAAAGGGGGLTQEEAAVLQKLQRTLVQMESRVEALETILIEQVRTEKNYGSKL